MLLPDTLAQILGNRHPSRRWIIKFRGHEVHSLGLFDDFDSQLTCGSHSSWVLRKSRQGLAGGIDALAPSAVAFVTFAAPAVSSVTFAPPAVAFVALAAPSVAFVALAPPSAAVSLAAVALASVALPAVALASVALVALLAFASPAALSLAALS